MRFLSCLRTISAPKLLAPIVLATLSNVALAFPVTYEFQGYVTDFHDPDFVSTLAANEQITGSVTYDLNYDGSKSQYGWPPGKPAMLNWSISLGDNSYHQGDYVNLNTHLISCCYDDSLYFSDEMPENSDGVPFLDQGGFGFKFSDIGNVFPEYLPVENFIAGSFSFGGGSHGPDSRFAGVINELNIKAPVPEPSLLSLFGIGLAGLFLTRRQKPDTRKLPEISMAA